MPKGRFAKDLTGQTFGLLTVARRAPNYISKTGQEAVWHCHCECGNELDVRAGQLRSGHTKSCGCFQKKAAAKSSTVHGGATTKLYGVWSSMKHRCTNPHDKRFKDYGGRGITVCQEWLHDFSAFQTWALSNGYQEGLTVDRINNDGGYSPNNCRWATMKEQMANQRPRRTKHKGREEKNNNDDS